MSMDRVLSHDYSCTSTEMPRRIHDNYRGWIDKCDECGSYARATTYPAHIPDVQERPEPLPMLNAKPSTYPGTVWRWDTEAGEYVQKENTR